VVTAPAGAGACHGSVKIAWGLKQKAFYKINDLGYKLSLFVTCTTGAVNRAAAGQAIDATSHFEVV
jgi:hypothetical protein